jgi:hypothetical protein
MSDGIKKVIIRKLSLPPVGDNNELYVRYRVVSDDRNRTSHWSQIKVVESTPVEDVNGSISLSGNIVIAVWDDDQLRSNYDVFVKNDSQDYVYHGTTSVHSYSFINEALSTVKVAIQIEGKTKTRLESLTIFESDPIVV